MKTLLDYIAEAEYASNNPVAGDDFDIIINEECYLSSHVIAETSDGFVLEATDAAIAELTRLGMLSEDNSRIVYGEVNHDMADDEEVEEAEYQGRKVPLGKPMAGDVKKSKVYVKNPKTGKVIKVNFGDKNMRIKKNIPGRRKNFRARHNCDNPGPRTKARYWSCRAW
jgi:hypothetical protein